MPTPPTDPLTNAPEAEASRPLAKGMVLDPITAENWPVSHRRSSLVALYPQADSQPPSAPTESEAPSPEVLRTIGTFNARSRRDFPWIQFLLVLALTLLIVRACG